MAKTYEYLVYRNGSNAANQSRETGWVPIAIVRAASKEAAEATTWGDEKPNVHGCPRLAAEIVESCGNLDVWSNQYTRAVPASRAPLRDLNALYEAAAMVAGNW